MDNRRIAEMFDEIADMLELEEGDHRFEIRAYRKAAINIESMQEDVEEILKKEGMRGLMEIPGIGEGLAKKIKEFVDTGKMKKYEDFKRKYPIDFDSLTRIQGLGAKRIFKLYKALKVKDVGSLKKALGSHRIKDIGGFSERSEAEISRGLETAEAGGGRVLLGTALPEAEAIVNKILGSGLAEKAEVAGSIRRMQETIGDIDILIVSSKKEDMMGFVAGMDEVDRVTAKGPTKTTAMLKNGMRCDFRVVDKQSFGSAMQYFTGSKDHGVACRQIAMKKGLKLSEYGLFGKKGKPVAGETEKGVYERLGMQYIEPEMREDRGEIALAMKHKLPALVRIDDIKGDLHVHTEYSDGMDTIEDMAMHAKELGFEYLGMSDHTKSEYVAKGMDDEKFKKYFDAIDKAMDKIKGIRILKSAEIDILKDGSLDLKDSTMDMMDYRLATVHMSRNMDKDEMTSRIIKAFETGYVDIWAHPTGRLINEREPLQLDLDRLFAAAKDNGVAVEIDSYPNRLDLGDESILKARRHGLKFAIDTDSHRAGHMELMRYGIGTARRGWLEKKDVINTLGYSDLLRAFRG